MAKTVDKFLGRDCELSSTGLDARGGPIPPWDVTCAVLREIDAAFEPHGTRSWSRPGFEQRRAWGASSTDTLRSWAPNGQCFYSDMSHVEVCTAETKDPRTFAAQSLATLYVAETARRRAEERAGDGREYALSTSNVDPLDPGVAWGSHVNVSVSSALWELLFVEHGRPAVLGFVSTAMAALIPFFGAGYLLPLRDGSVTYGLSARAHHVTRIATLSTTEAFRRGLLNSRREAHADGQERLHLIGFDYGVLSSALLGSMLQCVLAAAEEGFCHLNAYEPVRALHAWSLGFDLESGTSKGTARMVDGRALSLADYVRELTETLSDMVHAGLIEERVAPGAGELLPLVVELAEACAGRDLERCARHLDWAAKGLTLLDLVSSEGLALSDPELRLADHDFCNTNPERGAFWALWEAGVIDPLVTRADVEACLVDGPADSRGFARGRLVQRFGASITELDWGHVELRRSDDRWAPRVRVLLPRPGSLTRPLAEGPLTGCHDVADLEAWLRSSPDAESDETDPLLDVHRELAGDSRT